jgi:hypothetical protein
MLRMMNRKLKAFLVEVLLQQLQSMWASHVQRVALSFNPKLYLEQTANGFEIFDVSTGEIFIWDQPSPQEAWERLAQDFYDGPLIRYRNQ